MQDGLQLAKLIALELTPLRNTFQKYRLTGLHARYTVLRYLNYIAMMLVLSNLINTNPFQTRRFNSKACQFKRS